MPTNPAKLLLRVSASLAVILLTGGFKYAYDTDAVTGLPRKWAPGSIPVQILADNTTVLSDGTTRATSIQTVIQDSIRGWNIHLGDVQFVPQILPAGSGVDGDRVNQIFFSSSAYGKSWEANTLALTTAWYVGNNRVEADIIFNSAVTWDSYRGPVKPTAVDVQRVAFHELGHALGLTHPDEVGLTVQSVMNSSAVSADSLQPYDVLAAQFLYGPVGIPSYDNFASASVITLNNDAATVSGYNTNSGKETGEPNHAGNAGGRSVWWKWTALSSGTATVTTDGSAFNTTLGIYTGSAVSALTTIASNDDLQPGVAESSAVTFAAVAGTTYYIAVDGFNLGDGNGADSGGIALHVSFAPTYTVPNVTVASGHSVVFTTSAPGSIQWQASTNGGVAWVNITDGNLYSGATTSTLTMTNVGFTLSGFRYRALVTASDGSSAPTGSGTLLVIQAFFNFPAGITIDAAGNLYVTDTSLETVQKITSTTSVSALAGSTSTAGSTDGGGAAARFNQPSGLSATSDGTLGVSDTANATIRVIQPDGTVTTLAGNPSLHGSTDGSGTTATFSSPIGMARDSAGTLYVADATNHTIRKITSAGAVSTFAGTAGIAGSVDGTGNAARFNNPTGIALDGSGNVYVADTTNNLLRKITPAGAVSTIAGVVGVMGSSDGTGSAALFNAPGGLAVDSSGNVYLADTGNSTIRKITPANLVTTLAGLPGVAGIKDGSGSDAWFNQPKALTVDPSGNLFVADTGNAAIRKVTPAGVVTTLALTGTSANTSTSTSITSTTSTIPPTGNTSGGGSGGAPSTWFLGALGLLACLRRFLGKKG